MLRIEQLKVLALGLALDPSPCRMRSDQSEWETVYLMEKQPTSVGSL